MELFTDEGYNLSVDLNKTYKVKYSPYKKISLWNNTHHFEESGSREQAPFFFEDIDLDGVDEIVITDFQAGQRHSNEYSVYKNFSRLSKSDYKVIKTEPFDHIDQLTTFNKNSKTISQFHSGGSCANSEDTYKKTNKGFEFVEFTNWDSRPTMEYGYVCTKLTYGIVRDEKVIKSKSESYWDSEKSENIKLGTKYY